jgi:hypothetical protein
VKLEGKNACRLSDPMSMNGNQSNTVTAGETQPGNLGGAGPEVDDLCRAFCWCDAGKDPDEIVDIKRIPVGTAIEA